MLNEIRYWQLRPASRSTIESLLECLDHPSVKVLSLQKVGVLGQVTKEQTCQLRLFAIAASLTHKREAIERQDQSVARDGEKGTALHRDHPDANMVTKAFVLLRPQEQQQRHCHKDNVRRFLGQRDRHLHPRGIGTGEAQRDHEPQGGEKEDDNLGQRVAPGSDAGDERAQEHDFHQLQEACPDLDVMPVE